jgi:hypothetical protein
MLTLVDTLLLCPLRIGVYPRWSSLFWLLLTVPCDLVFVFDLILQHRPQSAARLSLSSQYGSLLAHTQGRLSDHLSDHSSLARCQRALLLLLSVVACLPLEILVLALQHAGYGDNYIAFVLLLRIARVPRMVTWLSELSLYVRDLCPSLLPTIELRRVVSFLLIITFAVHWAACIWMWLGNYAPETGWLAHDGPYQLWLRRSIAATEQATGGPLPPDAMGPPYWDWWAEYIRSVYFILVAVSTIGFGDIYPHTIAETAYVLCFITFGAILYPAACGAIGSLIILSLTRQSKQDAQVREFLRRNSIPRLLRAQIVAFTQLGKKVRRPP